MQTKKGFGGVGKLPVVSGPAVVLALFVLILLALLIVPLPRFILDLLLVSNLVFSLVLLLLALFLESWSSLYAFPTILLLSTLFRLALNVSSTRLILLHGDTGRDAAGRVIEAFGNLVVQGDFTVGVVIFAIIATVNFIVITKGAGRVAEVAARFTLDSLPGKQFAIDADLRNGAITREQAQRLRHDLERESQFYGAMDGAIKFVQGDAIAAMVIVFINAVGGVLIGVSRGLPIEEAVRTFGVLTMGDGLVHLIPAVLVSVCAGLVTTRVGASGTDTGTAVISQMSREPRVVIIAALVLLILSVLPGMPFSPFALVASLLLASVLWSVAKTSALQHADSGQRAGILQAFAHAMSSLPHDLDNQSASKKAVGISYESVLPVPLLLEFSPELDQSAIVASFELYQSELFQQRGFIVPQPSLRILAAGTEAKDSEQNPVTRYSIAARGRQIRADDIPSQASFIVLNQEASVISGLQSLKEERHPLSLAEGRWCRIDAAAREVLLASGVSVYTAEQFLGLVVVAVALENVQEFFGVSETVALLNSVKASSRALYEEVVEKGLLSVVELNELFRRLLSDKLPISDPVLLLDGIARAAALRQAGEDRAAFVDYLHAAIRRVLAKHLISDGKQGVLGRSFVIGPELQDVFREGAEDAETGDLRIAISPDTETALRARVSAVFGPAIARGATPIAVIAPADIRKYVDSFLAEQYPSSEWYRTLAFEELDGRNSIQTLGVLE